MVFIFSPKQNVIEKKKLDVHELSPVSLAMFRLLVDVPKTITIATNDAIRVTYQIPAKNIRSAMAQNGVDRGAWAASKDPNPVKYVFFALLEKDRLRYFYFGRGVWQNTWVTFWVGKKTNELLSPLLTFWEKRAKFPLPFSPALWDILSYEEVHRDVIHTTEGYICNDHNSLKKTILEITFLLKSYRQF